MLDELKHDSLSPEQIEFFNENGFVLIPGAFSPQTARECADVILDIVKNENKVDFSKPEKARYGVSRRAAPEFDAMITPRLTAAFDGLAGKGGWDPEHIKTHGNFFATFPGFQIHPWKVPAGTGRWHIDLGFESRDAFDLLDGNCGFVPAFLVTPSKKDGAPTLAIPGSHKVISRLLATSGKPIDRYAMVAFCEGWVTGAGVRDSVVQMLGNAGDVVIMHPHLIHCASSNATDEIRIMGNTGMGRTTRRMVLPEDGSRSVIDLSIWQAIKAIRPSSLRRSLLGMLLAVNHRIWKLRYNVHGALPSSLELPLPLHRKVPERVLRSLGATLSGLIARLAV